MGDAQLPTGWKLNVANELWDPAIGVAPCEVPSLRLIRGRFGVCS